MMDAELSTSAGTVERGVHYVRIFTDATGEARIDEQDVTIAQAAFAPPAPPLWISRGIAARNLIFCEFPVGWDGPLHPAPARQYIVLLSGELEIMVPDGSTRRLTAGSIVLVEDVSGRGHRTRVIGDTSVRGAFIQLA